MNIFYTPPKFVQNDRLELRDQEMKHATKVLRYSEGDDITVVDGEGGWYDGIIRHVAKKTAVVEITDQTTVSPPKPELTLGLGVIKKRDRLEFAVEKAVELGARRVALFKSKHTERDRIRMDRLESIALSAMKQSLRSWRPEVTMYPSLSDLVDDFSESPLLIAHEKAGSDAGIPQEKMDDSALTLLVGPEGGFAENEVQEVRDAGGEVVSLGSYRLRAETAALVMMSQFIQ